MITLLRGRPGPPPCYYYYTCTCERRRHTKHWQSIFMLPINCVTFQYSMWPGIAGAGTMSYSQPGTVMQQPSVSGAYPMPTSGLPPGQTGNTSAHHQYYVFHPNLTRPEPGAAATDKPSLLEMENSYLVKHGGVAGSSTPNLSHTTPLRVICAFPHI